MPFFKSKKGSAEKKSERRYVPIGRQSDSESDTPSYRDSSEIISRPRAGSFGRAASKSFVSSSSSDYEDPHPMPFNAISLPRAVSSGHAAGQMSRSASKSYLPFSSSDSEDQNSKSAQKKKNRRSGFFNWWKSDDEESRPRAGSFGPAGKLSRSTSKSFVPSSSSESEDYSSKPAQKKKNRLSGFFSGWKSDSEDSDIKKERRSKKVKPTKIRTGKPSPWESSSDSDEALDETSSNKLCRVFHVDGNYYIDVKSDKLKLKPTQPSALENDPHYMDKLDRYWNEVQKELKRNDLKPVLLNLSDLMRFCTERFQGHKDMMLKVEINTNTVPRKEQAQYPFAKKRVLRVGQPVSSTEKNLLMPTLYWLIATGSWATFTFTKNNMTMLKIHISGRAMREPVEFLSRLYDMEYRRSYRFPEHDLFD